MRLQVAENSSSPRLRKKVQVQGGTPMAERGVLEVRRSEWRGARGTHPEDGSPQMGLFSSLSGVQEDLLQALGVPRLAEGEHQEEARLSRLQILGHDGAGVHQGLAAAQES